MGKNTSVSLGDYYDNFIQDNLRTGRFKNASEVIRAALRLLEEEENRIIALKNAIQEGIESGYEKNFDPVTHLKKLKENKENE
jgi:antitoxin ParD1/3/4